jgi:hypothetical protein
MTNQYLSYNVRRLSVLYDAVKDRLSMGEQNELWSIVGNLSRLSVDAPEPTPQAPIARLHVSATDLTTVVSAHLYAPGLPSGDYDFYCEPALVAPYLTHPDPTGKTREPPHCPSCSCGTPADLVGALQDKVHEDTGAVRAGRSVKVLPPCPSVHDHVWSDDGPEPYCLRCRAEKSEPQS